MNNKEKISKTLIDNTKKLADLDAISSREEIVAQYIKKSLNGSNAFVFERDGLGSLAVIKKSKVKDAPTISFTAHMDEVGFMVTKIDQKGFIYFTPVGGWWGHVVLGQLLQITTSENKKIVGIVGSTPPHLLSRETFKNVIPIKKMFLDIGANTKKEVEELGIAVGDQITPKTIGAFETLNNRIIAKAHDDRVSIAVGIEIMERIKDIELDINVIFVASVQEEVGLRGARTSSFKWTPDIGFAIDVTIANDTPGMEERETKLGSGPALSMFDSSVIANPALLSYVAKIADKNKITFTYDSLTGGGTDAGLIHLAKSGVISMTVSIPSRYMHSHNSMIDLVDAQNTVELFVGLLNDFDQKSLDKIVYK